MQSVNFPPKNPSERLVKATEDLKAKGYGFSKEKVLRPINPKLGTLDESTGFVFEVRKDNKAFNQKNYEDIGDIITEYVYGLLESDPINLVRKEFPDGQEEKSFVYVSEDINEKDELCVIIHGSGVVRAGQWARRLIMNENLDLGTILPEIIEAKQKKFAILVMNTNDNFRINSETSEKFKIKSCENALKSSVTTWRHFVEKSNHKKIVIIGHSYGGAVSLNLAAEFAEDFEKRVIAVLLTDAAHGYLTIPAFLRKICINFVASEEPLDTDLGVDGSGIMTRSAGNPVHEWTPSSTRPLLFTYIDQALTKKTNF